MLFMCEVLASIAHVAPYVCEVYYFYPTAEPLTSNNCFSRLVDGKSVSDRFERLHTIFHKKDIQDGMISGVGGKVTEVDELLFAKLETLEEEAIQRNERREEVRDR